MTPKIVIYAWTGKKIKERGKHEKKKNKGSTHFVTYGRYYTKTLKNVKNVRADLIKDLFEKEQSYWWHTCKRKMVFSLALDLGHKQNQRGRALGVDIGCGAGYAAKEFEAAWRMVGADVSRDALEFCRHRGLKRLCRVDMANFSLPFKKSSFDVVLALDVIEHIKDDVHALAECRRILKPGGLMVVMVPAFMALWSPWDDALGHRRRYTDFNLAKAIQQAGLSVKTMTYMFLFVFPIAAVIRYVKRLVQRDAGTYSSDFIPIPRVLNKLLIQTGRLEQWLINRLHVRLPFGLSVIAVVTKE